MTDRTDASVVNGPPEPGTLSAKQTAALIELLKNPSTGEADFLVDLISNRVPAGVDDAAKVKAKLAEGGKPGGFEFTLTTNNIPLSVQEAEVIQAQLRDAGITMKIKLVDASTLISDGNAKNFEMISFQWSGRPDPDGNIYQFFKTTPGTSFNWSGIC